MRLDKYLCDALGISRKEATRLLKTGDITLDDQVVKTGASKVLAENVVEWQGRELSVSGPRYIMLNKPQGFVCSHEDGSNQTAFTLLDEVNMDKLHFAGRLDVDTTGLVLITDDGQWSHRITSRGAEEWCMRRKSKGAEERCARRKSRGAEGWCMRRREEKKKFEKNIVDKCKDQPKLFYNCPFVGSYIAKTL